MSNEHELQRARLEYEAWKKTRNQILAALRGNPQATAENFKEVERLQQREKQGDDNA